MLRFSQFRHAVRGVDVPRIALKWLNKMDALSEWLLNSLPCAWRAEMKFLRHLAFALRWKSFVLASPSLIHVNLDLCLILMRRIAEKPRILDFASLCSSSSSVDNCLCSYALSSCNTTSVAMSELSFSGLICCLLHFFKALPSLDSLICKDLILSFALTGVSQLAFTVSKKLGSFNQ